MVRIARPRVPARLSASDAPASAAGLPARFLGGRLIVALLVVLMTAVGAASAARAVMPDEMLDDPVLEQRAREISKGLRCVVCQSESIDESNAELARDMRVRVRTLLTDGLSDEQVREWMVDRYGDYVLMRPPFKWTTLALWFGPLVFLAVGLVFLIAWYRGRPRPAAADATAGGTGGSADAEGPPDPGAAPLTDDEKRRLDALLVGDGEEPRR